LDPVSQDVFKEEIRELANQGTAILLSSHQMNLVEEICDRLFMMEGGQKVIYGSLDDVKTEYANFKCTIRGKNDLSMLESIAGVERVSHTESTSVFYLENDFQAASLLRQLPEELAIQEMSLDRISLHEIFIDIATDKNL